jgi:hypothetical protein
MFRFWIKIGVGGSVGGHGGETVCISPLMLLAVCQYYATAGRGPAAAPGSSLKPLARGPVGPWRRRGAALPGGVAELSLPGPRRPPQRIAAPAAPGAARHGGAGGGPAAVTTFCPT